MLRRTIALAAGTVPVAPPPDHGPYTGLFLRGTGLVTIRIGEHQQTIELPKDGRVYTVNAAWGPTSGIKYTVHPPT